MGVPPAPPQGTGDSQVSTHAINRQHSRRLRESTTQILQTAAQRQRSAASSPQPQHDMTPRQRRQQRVLQQQTSEEVPPPEGASPPPLLQQPEAPLELGRQPLRPQSQQPQRPPAPVQPQQRPPAAAAPPPQLDAIYHREIVTRPAPQPERAPGQPAGSVGAGQVSVGEATRPTALPTQDPRCASSRVAVSCWGHTEHTAPACIPPLHTY